MFLFRRASSRDGAGRAGDDAGGQSAGDADRLDSGCASGASGATDEAAETIDVQLLGALDVGAVLSAKLRMPKGSRKARFKWQRLGRLGAGHTEIITVRAGACPRSRGA